MKKINNQFITVNGLTLHHLFLMMSLLVCLAACADQDPDQMITYEMEQVIDEQGHAIPQVPFLLDGKPANASDLLQHKGTLTYILIGEEKLNIFSKTELAEKHKAEMRTKVSNTNANVNAGGKLLILYEHANYTGAYLDFSYDSWNIRDFRWESWGIFTNINDKVSSLCVVTTSYGRGIKLYEHINYGGDSFEIFNTFLPNLSIYGWNDRISSMHETIRLEPVGG